MATTCPSCHMASVYHVTEGCWSCGFEAKPKPRDSERDRAEIAARLSSPKRPTTPQHDPAHLPLFIAGNEPAFL